MAVKQSITIVKAFTMIVGTTPSQFRDIDVSGFNSGLLFVSADNITSGGGPNPEVAFALKYKDPETGRPSSSAPAGVSISPASVNANSASTCEIAKISGLETRTVTLQFDITGSVADAADVTITFVGIG